MKIKRAGIVFMLFFGVCTYQVRSEVINIRITGEVTEGYGSIWQEGVHEGSIFSGIYTYDTATLNTGTVPGVGEYVYNSPYGINMSLEGFEFKTDPSHVSQFVVTILNDVSINRDLYDHYVIASHKNVPLSNGDIITSISWGLLDSTHTAISSNDLPVTPPVLNNWPQNRLEIYGLDSFNHSFYLRGTVTQAVLIPEPATSTLMLMIGLFLFNRRH
jgi:hypothetical protein